MDMNHARFARWLVLAGLIEQFVFDSIEGGDLSRYVVLYEQALRKGA